MKSFKELGLNENIINGLNKQGIETQLKFNPYPFQIY